MIHLITIAAVRSAFGVSPLLFVLVTGFGLYWVIKHQKYSEAMLCASVLGCFVSFIWGMSLVREQHGDGQIAGSIMMLAGLWVLAWIGVQMQRRDSGDPEC